MTLINWQEDYSVGIKELDDQHKKMFDLINSLYQSMKTVKDIGIRQEILNELMRYGKNHLTTEEKYFEKYNYPDKEKHKNAHDFYRKKISEFIEKKDDTLLSYEIIDFLEDWWIGHILFQDKKYQEYLTKYILTID